jgi:Response regulator containing a CheY-like receiver domain and an HTH DNA-binding domain
MTKRILLADDDADDRLLFEEAFSDLPPDKYELITLANGEEVLSFLNQSKAPDLIVLDQNMPLLSGRETALRIKETADFSTIPLIIYSTYNDRSFVRDCLAIGVRAVVSKPDSFEGFVDMVNNLLTHSHQCDPLPLPVPST